MHRGRHANLSLDDIEQEVGGAALAQETSQLEAAVHRLHQINDRVGQPPSGSPGGDQNNSDSRQRHVR